METPQPKPPPTEKKNSYISGSGTFYISGNGNPKKLLMIQEVTFRARKIKNKIKKTLIKLLIFREMELSSTV